MKVLFSHITISIVVIIIFIIIIIIITSGPVGIPRKKKKKNEVLLFNSITLVLLPFSFLAPSDYSGSNSDDKKI